MRLVFATVMSSRLFSEILTEVGVKDRLLSFYELQKCNDSLVEHFVMTGLNPTSPTTKKQKYTWRHSTYMNRRRLALLHRIESYEREAGAP